MRVVFTVLYLVTLVYLIILLVRMVLDWVQVFARDWHPSGALLVLAEVVYSATDPPLRALRRVIPSVGFGQVRLDLGFMVLVLGIWILLSVFGALS